MNHSENKGFGWGYRNTSVVERYFNHGEFSQKVPYTKTKALRDAPRSTTEEALQERYRNLSFQKTKESILKHHLLYPSIYKIMQRWHSYSLAFTLSVKHEQEQY